MNINELAFDVALWGDFGEFNKIHDLGWSTKEEFLSGIEEMKGVKWIDMADGRKIMSVPHSFGEAGLDCRFIVRIGLQLINFHYLRPRLDFQRRENPIIKSHMMMKTMTGFIMMTNHIRKIMR